MLYINSKSIKENNEIVKCNLNYPFIKKQEYKKNIISVINQLIYEDVISFKHVINDNLSNSRFNDILNIISEYKVAFNENDIISIPIEFSQLIGLYDITYVNCYNYDIGLGQYISLRDIFDTTTNIRDIISENISNEIKLIANEYCDSYEDFDKANKFKYIDDDQDFYIEEDGVVICFSSYEMSKDIPHFIEIKLLFSDYKDYLSKYTINNIWRNKDKVTH